MVLPGKKKQKQNKTETKQWQLQTSNKLDCNLIVV